MFCITSRYEPHIGPICLPQKDTDITEGTVAMVAGWGAMEPDAKERPVDLQTTDVLVVSGKRCEKWHIDNNIKVLGISRYNLHYLFKL